jgi:hypothetical protein
LRKTKPVLQIVASSRFPVPELAARGFISIELLPFRPEQVKRFVQDFISSDAELASEVVFHLEQNPNMLEVVKTPLMSTILCVLAKNGVTLPSTKNDLFKERFELLWGVYDAKKGVRRVTSRKSCLEDVSKKAAYFLHSYSSRSMDRQTILQYVTSALNRKYSPKVVATAFAELERPCNVLVEDGEGMVGFGHLSYQEYLVSEELYSSRHGEIVKYLGDPWWRGVLVLTAMKTEDIGSFIEDRIIDAGLIGDARETLYAMIQVCAPTQRYSLLELLRSQESLDEMSRLDDFDQPSNDDSVINEFRRFNR